MPSSKERGDAELVDDGERAREKRPTSKTERGDRDKDRARDRDRDRDRDREKERDRDKDKDKDRERDRDRDRDRDRERDPDRPRKHKSKSSKSKSTGESELLYGSSKKRRPRERDKDRDSGIGSDSRNRAEDGVGGGGGGRGGGGGGGSSGGGTSSQPGTPSGERAMDANSSLPELSRTKMASVERVAMPYPSFSKAHSKENVRSREDVSKDVGDPPTPDATDVGMKRSKSVDYTSSKTARKASAASSSSVRRTKEARPPSPPDTNVTGEGKRRGSPSVQFDRDVDTGRPRSWVSSSTWKNDGKSKVSLKSKASSQATFIKSPAFRPPTVETSRDAESLSGISGSAATSVATKRVLSGARVAIVEGELSPESAPDSSPKTPVQTPQFPPPLDADGKPMVQFVDEDDHPTPSQTPGKNLNMAVPPPPPAPPPPPPLSIQEVPRVDYLMQNGGLAQQVPRTFLAVLPRQNGTRPSNPPLRGAETLFAPFFNLLDQYQAVITRQGSVAVATGHRTVARRLLDRLEDVFNRDLPPDGCACVICERSVEPRRGLGWGEVLERVSGRLDLPAWPPFDLATLGINAVEKSTSSKDLPHRPASPVKIDPDIADEFREHYLRQSKKVRSAVDKWLNSCAEAPAPPPTDVDDETLTFAILTNLETDDRPFFNALINGSRELQPATRAPTPMRKPRVDFVVKTGLALQRLYRLAQAPRDAETVMYLIKNRETHDLLHTITDINPSEWEILTSGRFDGFLWSGADTSGGANDDAITPTADNPLSRGATPASGMAFFPSAPPPPPRLATISPNVFRSHTPGAGFGMAPPSSRNTTPFSGLSGTPFSRGTTPASVASGFASRGATPASFVSGFPSPYGNGSPSAGGPSNSNHNRPAVSLDEETEVAVLAEIEREIYTGMETLEDAFERLHERAEVVRTALRQRGAGLSMSLQHRRGGIDVLPQSGDSGRFDRPAWAGGGGGGGGGAGGDEDMSAASESDWGADDMDSIAPDDSASNISSSRHRRPKRRNERRTPAPIEEENYDEG